MSAEHAGGDLSKSRILVVDDSKITRRKLRSDLNEDGFTVIEEADCAEAGLQMLNDNEEYDLVLVDMLMPGMDGAEMIRQLRADGRFSDIPVIMVTISEEKDLVKRCFQLGASDFLRKPWDVTDLAARVKSHLERHFAQRALSRSEKRFTQAMEASRDGLWELDIKSGTGYFSPGFYRMLGYKPADFAPTFAEWKRLIHPDDLPRFETLIKSVFDSGREHFEVEVRLQNRNHSWNWIRCRANIVAREESGYPARVVGLNEDITSHVMTQKILQKYANEMEQLADQRAKALVHNERLATIGTMSAGIAHEINNPLSYISGNAQIIRKVWPELESFVLEALKSRPGSEKLSFICEQLPGIISGICDGVERITGIVRSMKDFSRKEAQEKRSVDIVEPIENSLLLCHNALKRNIEVIKNYNSGQCFVPMRRQQIEQVMINLITNAVQAMNGSGKLYISVLTVGEYARIAVRDTGPGITPDTLKKIFDPFFTTKPEGVGTGLGLSISKGIMQDHGGSIEAANNSEGGAEFTLLLPLRATGLEEAADSEQQVKILLLEDVPAMQERIAERMRAVNAHLLFAATGQEARSHMLFSKPDAVLISLSGGELREAAELFALRLRKQTSIPFFIISRRNRLEIEAATQISIDGIPIFEILSSQAIGEIYNAALGDGQTEKEPPAEK